VTAFPPRWSEITPSNNVPQGTQAKAEAELDTANLYGKVFSAMTKSASIGSPEDLVCLIIDKCSALFHPSRDEFDVKIDYLDVFAISIGVMV
jgi:hypothetical protein